MKQMARAVPRLPKQKAVAAGAGTALVATPREAAPRAVPPRDSASLAAGSQPEGMVHSMLCAVASGSYNTAQEGHLKLYKTLALLVETLPEAEIPSARARHSVKTLKAIMQIAVASAEHLGTRPGCGLNAMLRYTNSQLMDCLLSPDTTTFNATAAAAALEAARSENGRAGGGSGGGGGGARRGGGGGGGGGNRGGGGARRDRERERERERSPPPRSPDRGGDRYKRVRR
jgi:uncharacterized membrane protein YgcG